MNESLDDRTKRSKLIKKWGFVEDFLRRAASEQSRSAWWINFASASGPPTSLNPVDFAKGKWGEKGVNWRLNEYLKSNPAGHYGLVVTDFPEYPNDGEVIRHLILTNFPLISR
jgi:hypothetical protein